MNNFTPEQDQYLQKEQTRAYYRGLRDGVEKFAWWKNGTQYVGTTGAVLKDVLHDIDTFESEDMERITRLTQV